MRNLPLIRPINFIDQLEEAGFAAETAISYFAGSPAELQRQRKFHAEISQLFKFDDQFQAFRLETDAGKSQRMRSSGGGVVDDGGVVDVDVDVGAGTRRRG